MSGRLLQRFPRPLCTGALCLLLATANAGATEPELANSTAPVTFSLREVVALAKARAPAVHAAFARMASAHATVERAGATLLPTVYAQASGTGFAANGQVFSGGIASGTTKETYVVGAGSVTLQWNLYDFGRTSSAVQGARAGETAAAFSAHASEQAAMSEAAIAFFTLLADDDLVRAAEVACADREHVVDITHRLVEAGYRTPIDETRTRIALDVARLDLSVSKAGRDNDSVALATALMLDPGTAFHLVPPAPFRVDQAAWGDDAKAVSRRLDVAAATARVDQSRHGLEAARRAQLPVLGVSATGQALYAHDSSFYPGTPVASTTNGATEMAQGMVTLGAPLLDPLMTANVHVAEAALSESQAGLDQLSQSARGEVLQAVRQVKSAQVVLEQCERLAAGTAANLAVVEERYEKGLDSPLALADAQREEAAARGAIVRARLAYSVAAVKLLSGLSRVDELLTVK